MSLAGLRFNKSHEYTPHETKSGSYVYHGGAASFHDWSFRAQLRIQRNEQRIAALFPEEYDEGEDEEGTVNGASAGNASKSSRAYAVGKAKELRAKLVDKILEGLRGDAFPIARDYRLAKLQAEHGLENLVSKIKQHVFHIAR